MIRSMMRKATRTLRNLNSAGWLNYIHFFQPKSRSQEMEIHKMSMAGLLTYSSAAPPSQSALQGCTPVDVAQFHRKSQQRVLSPILTAFPILKP